MYVIYIIVLKMIIIGIIYFLFFNDCKIGLILTKKKPTTTDIKNVGNL